MKEYTYTITITGVLDAKNEDQAEERAAVLGELFDHPDLPQTKHRPKFDYQTDEITTTVEEL